MHADTIFFKTIRQDKKATFPIPVRHPFFSMDGGDVMCTLTLILSFVVGAVDIPLLGDQISWPWIADSINIIWCVIMPLCSNADIFTV